MNDRVVPFFDEHEIVVSRVLTDRGTEYCGKPESHEYELYLAIENMDHIAHEGEEPADQRHLRAVPQDAARWFYRVAFRKKFYRRIDELQAISTPGLPNTTRGVHIKGDGAMARRRCKPSLTRCR